MNTYIKPMTPNRRAEIDKGFERWKAVYDNW